ncbi:hypothetical protein J6590_066288 [Homalodisca vitripennis]|nr:hypothetical protein J6590_066288 [Homalodisca vitripennis]
MVSVQLFTQEGSLLACLYLPVEPTLGTAKTDVSINLANLMDVQERHITNRQCRDSGVQGGISEVWRVEAATATGGRWSTPRHRHPTPVGRQLPRFLCAYSNRFTSTRML